MGISTVAIGLLPTYHSIGIIAPLLLMLCRFGQGLGLGYSQTIFLYFGKASSVERLRQNEFRWGDFSLQVLRQINDKELSQGLDHRPQAA